MGKKVIILVCVFLPVAFLGLMAMQVWWIMEACSLRDNEFDQVVQKCVETVVQRLEADELAGSRPNKNLAARDFMAFTQMRQSAMKGKNVDLKEVTITFTMDNYGFYKLNTQKEGQTIATDAGVLDNRIMPGNDEAYNSMMMLDDVLTKRIKTMESAMNRSVFEDRSITDRVNPQRLDALLMQQLTDNGIDAPYEYAVYNSAGSLAFSSPAYDAKGGDKIYEKKLFPNDMHARAHFMRIYFPERPNTLHSLMFLIVPTVLFMLIVGFLSSYTVWIIFHQKKLDDIKNDFIGNMTHEFKTPISTISLAAQMLRDMAKTVTSEFIERNTGIIIDEAKRLTIQVEKILQMASFDRGTAKMRFVERDVNEIIYKVINNFRVKIESENGEINGRYDAEDPFAMVDDVHFTNVIYNLLDNAFKYRRDAPMIEVATQNVEGGLQITVRDNGIGISKEDQKRIFDKFYRVSTGDRHDIKGFGLGLAYVSKIVESHGGQITVDSELNVGTKFNIFIPQKK